MHRKEMQMKKLNINNHRYLGSKYKLLDFINETIEKNCGKFETFFLMFLVVLEKYQIIFMKKGKKYI